MGALVNNTRKMKYVRYRNNKELFLEHLDRIQQCYGNWKEPMTRTLDSLKKLRQGITWNPTKLHCHTCNPEHIKEELRIDNQAPLRNHAFTLPTMTNFDQIKTFVSMCVFPQYSKLRNESEYMRKPSKAI